MPEGQKLDCCLTCEFNDHETIGCAGNQLKWAFEQLLMDLPIIGDAFRKQGFSACGWYTEKEEA